jgi:iron complex transport system substrate-binding protein
LSSSRAKGTEASSAPAAHPQRVVSLAPAVTETLFLLGRGASVVGVTRYCDRPKQALALPKVGGYVDVQLEVVLALKPDLVIAMPSFGQREVLQRMADHGVSVLVVFGDSEREVEEGVTAIGRAVDAIDEARALVDDNQKKLASLRAKALARPLRAAVLVGDHPLVVAGPGTFANDALSWIGAHSAVQPSSPSWPVWSLEDVAAAHLDVLVVAEGAEVATRVRQELCPALGTRCPRLVFGQEPLLMRPGPHMIDDAAALQKLLDRP